MPIESVNSLARPTATKVDTSNDKSEVQRDDFMKLLVAQMQMQDPLEPMDNREMITQLSQLTSVDKLASIEGRIGALEIATAGMANTQVVGIVGKTVTASVEALRLDDLGPAETVYGLTESATNVTVSIRNANGDVVRTMQMGDRPPGQHTVTWDGIGDSGERMPPGRYTVDIVAKNAAGTPVHVDQEVTGVVEGINYDGGFPELMIGSARIMLGDVRSIEQ